MPAATCAVVGRNGQIFWMSGMPNSPADYRKTNEKQADEEGGLF